MRRYGMYVCRLTDSARRIRGSRSNKFSGGLWGIYVLGVPLTSLPGHQTFIVQPGFGSEVLVNLIN